MDLSILDGAGYSSMYLALRTFDMTTIPTIHPIMRHDMTFVLERGKQLLAWLSVFESG